jgi:hypothetical protein
MGSTDFGNNFSYLGIGSMEKLVIKVEERSKDED